MKIDVAKIEQDIYYDICNDFAEYSVNRLNVYNGILRFLESISLEKLLSTPRETIYEMYTNFCNVNSLHCLAQKSFAKAMTGLCGFECVRKGSSRKGTINYYEISGGVKNES